MSAFWAPTLCFLVAVMAASADNPEGGRVIRAFVSGFEPFGTLTSNPSQDVAQALGGTCITMNSTKICFDSVVLPVNHDGAQYFAHYLSNLPAGQSNYDCVIHMGVYAGSADIHIETVAANIMAETSGGSIFADSLPFLPITADLQRIQIDDLLPNELAPLVASSRGKGTSSGRLVEWSRDAGTFYCNETLYRTLCAIRTGLVQGRRPSSIPRAAAPPGRSLLPAVFVHLPLEDAVPLRVDLAVVQRLAAALVDPSLLA
ncbi:hypothetical protein PAPYR_7463 [Paratrimastix pyriformis]|uniref:Pyrrolidone-carboxylate peptidase n=1 Tax=Paratrimastix pyriformis TaxID=342808 RepID=A0ABQ8UEH9_9EUKA|nr:hypothetical protein PAPYR_7463 [Paratrimastix pyriformis]